MIERNEPNLPSGELKVLRELSAGLNNHSNWLKTLDRTLICGERPVADDLADDAHRRCLFGRWYYGEQDESLRNRPQFAEVGTLHRGMHDTARRLLAESQAGHRISIKDYDNFVDISRRFRVAVQSLEFSLISKVCAVDHLTGVWNRYGLSYRLGEEYERVQRSGNPCVVAMLDFDHFKAVNDSYGHVAGDQVLKSVLEYCAAQMRRYDSIYRYGGEEFVFMFPETNLDEAKQIANRLREDIAALEVAAGEGVTIKVTVSIGLALMDGGSSKQAVIEMADAALFQAKMSGRNRVWVWQAKADR